MTSRCPITRYSRGLTNQEFVAVDQLLHVDRTGYPRWVLLSPQLGERPTFRFFDNPNAIAMVIDWLPKERKWRLDGQYITLPKPRFYSYLADAVADALTCFYQNKIKQAQEWADTFKPEPTPVKLNGAALEQACS